MQEQRVELISKLEELLVNVNDFRDSRAFYERLTFIKRSKYLAPYNAFLVSQQKESAQLVLSEKKWRQRGRELKEGARPIVIMIPFGPVEFVYDVEDTEGAPIANLRPNVPIPYEVRDIFGWDGNFRPLKSLYKNIMYKCRMKGLLIYEKALDVGLAGKASYCGERRGKKAKGLEEYEIVINANHPEEVKLPTLIHELAHIFCGHLTHRKELSHANMEFEAESVAYLYCYRNGFRPKSEQYLVEHLEEGWSPPLTLFNNILSSLKKIDQLSEADHEIDPDKCYFLEFHIGGYHGESFALKSQDCKTITYTRFGREFNELETENLYPSENLWRSFWKTCGNVGVGFWDKRYQAEGVVDGTRWGLTMDCGDFVVNSSGDNAYPANFNKVLLAVEKLLGGREFR